MRFPIFSRIFPKITHNFWQEMINQIMTIKEVAVYLKITEKTAYRLVAEGKIPGFKVGGAWRFQMSQIDQWIAQGAPKVASK